LGLGGLLMVFRFGVPALLFGATGPGPFGNSWLTERGTATPLVDADLRFFGAMMLGLGVIFFWTIGRVEELGPVIYILAGAVGLGAVARVYARIMYGNPGTAGTIPIVLEAVIPLFMIVLRHAIGNEAPKARSS
jgi:hypothetical protein